MTSGIYQIKNKVNNKIYIGQAINLSKRKAEHWSCLRGKYHYNSHLQRAWDKYGEENFRFIILLCCESAELSYYEQVLVNLLNPKYNIQKECTTSPLGTKLSKEHKAKISKSLKGIKRSQQTREKISRCRKGIIFSDEHKRHLRENHVGNLGKHCSEETIQKMALAQKGDKNHMFGKHISEEHKQKISMSNKGNKRLLGYKQSDEHRRHISESMLARQNETRTQEDT